jgi:hypothetical protein
VFLRLTSDIFIHTSEGKIRIPAAESVEIVSSYEELTDTCTIIFAKKVSWQGKPIAEGSNALFKRGDKVEVSLGYDGNNQLEFIGYIRTIKPQERLEILCEDAAFLLKKHKVQPKSWVKVTLPELVKYVSPIPFKASEVELGKLTVQGDLNAAQVLKKYSDYSIKAWCRNDTLYAGWAYWPELQKKHKFRFKYNIVDHDLTFTREEDISVKVKVESILPDNTRLSVEVGDSDGEVNKIPVYGVTSESELKKIGEEALKHFKKGGYTGSFTAFGKPSVNHGDIIILEDPDNHERNGEYVVKAVKKSFSSSGYRQQIKLAGAFKK